MGQYWKGVLLHTDKKTITKALHPHHFHDGLKLMEHAYINNPVVMAALQLLYDRGGSNFVWTGDYADNEEGQEQNLYGIADNMSACGEEVYVDRGSDHYFRYCINEDKKEYLDIDEAKKSDGFIHPLILLCAEGNGRGGGDYDGTSYEKVGSWARDFIRVSDEAPGEDYRQKIVNFEEY